MTSYSAQGVTAGRVIANIDTDGPRALINNRLAYVAISRASDDARIYTNDAATLGAKLATEQSKTSAIDFRKKSKTANNAQQQRTTYEYAHPEHRLAAVSADYRAHPDLSVVIAPDPAERRELNQLIRADLQAEGRIAADSRTIPVLIEQKLTNPKLAASYTPGDQIHYRTGSPELYGIPNNGAVTVVAVDPKSNTLTAATNDGGRIAYDPSQLRLQTSQSRVYREETRDLAIGERILLTAPDRSQAIRAGESGTIERFGNNNSLSVRLDSGRTVVLDSDKVKHTEYGYAVDGEQRVSADRVLATGETLKPADLAHISSQARELAVYSSEGSTHERQQPTPPAIAQAPPSPQQAQSLGLGLSL